LVIGENVHWEITDIYIKSAIIKLQARPGSQGFLVILQLRCMPWLNKNYLKNLKAC